MSHPEYNCPEEIFNVPNDITEAERYDSVCHCLERIKGTVLTSAQLLGSKGEYSPDSVRDCLYGVYSQLEILEKLVTHKCRT